MRYRIPKGNLKKYLVPADNNRKKLSFKRKILSEQQIKALTATIPFIPDIYELELEKCAITDIMSTVLLFSAFMNPYIKRFSLQNNPIRTNFR